MNRKVFGGMMLMVALGTGGLAARAVQGGCAAAAALLGAMAGLAVASALWHEIVAALAREVEPPTPDEDGPLGRLCAWHPSYFGAEQWLDAEGNPVPRPYPAPPLDRISHGVCALCKARALAEEPA